MDQEGYISRLDNDGIALVLIGQHSVSSTCIQKSGIVISSFS